MKNTRNERNFTIAELRELGICGDDWYDAYGPRPHTSSTSATGR